MAYSEQDTPGHFLPRPPSHPPADSDLRAVLTQRTLLGASGSLIMDFVPDILPHHTPFHNMTCKRFSSSRPEAGPGPSARHRHLLPDTSPLSFQLPNGNRDPYNSAPPPSSNPAETREDSAELCVRVWSQPLTGQDRRTIGWENARSPRHLPCSPQAWS